MVLQLVKALVGFLASVAAIGQMFTGVFMCRVISKKGSTKKIPSMPFIGGLALSILLLQHARFIGDGNMIAVNAFGVLINLCYIAFYYSYSKKKMRDDLISKLSKSMILVGLLLFYANLEDPEKVEYRFGWIVSIVMLSFIGFPLLSLPEIMEKQSTEGLPYPMIITGFVVSLLWFLYSLLIWNEVLIIQNGLAALLCGFQLYLFSLYPDKQAKTELKFE